MRERDRDEGRILQAIEAFNAMRAPEARARLARRSGERVWIEFTGCFCGTCGFYDYFEDLRIELEECGLMAALSAVTDTEDGAVVEFSLVP
ncbi:MAG: hypothetical protein QMD46_01980 [Methanomicrobiales archaeon]|nr:hypothetical protein [Methanomicrobiales archaeon]MDI6875210.1 hypothetical protein [Methanomicrobiales archaeon]